MENRPGNRYKIGKFATLCGVSKDTLFHYERMGLIEPDFVDENGYRYYSADQFFHMEMIKALKESGCSLEEIKDYKAHYNMDRYLVLLKKQKEKLDRELLRMHALSDALQNSILQIEETMKTALDAPHLEECAEEHLITWETQELMENNETTPADEVDGITALLRYCEKREITPLQPIGSIVERGMLEQGGFAGRYLFFRVHDGVKDDHVRVKPAGLYATVLHKDLYGGQRDAYHILMDYIQENHLTIVGDSYESEMAGYLGVGKPEDFIVRYSVMVEREK